MGNQTFKETSLKITPKTILAEIIHNLIAKKLINKTEADECNLFFGK